MKPNVLPVLPEKWWYPPAQVHTSLAGKTVIVTGANSGLGLEAAAKFVSLGASNVILAVRNISKGEAAQRMIEERTKKTGVLNVWELDMASFESIQSFAQRAVKELPCLDVLTLNAGIATGKYVVGAKGWESTLQVNVLGTALLDSHRWLQPSDFPDPTSYSNNMLQALNSSKQYNGTEICALKALGHVYHPSPWQIDDSTRWRSPETIVTGCCPGACKSSLARDLTGLPARIAFYVFGILAEKTAEQGSRTLVSAAALGDEAQGAWWKNDTLLSPGEYIVSEKGKEMQARCWKEIVETLKVKVPVVEGLASGQI